MCAIYLKVGEELVEMVEQPYEAENGAGRPRQTATTGGQTRRWRLRAAPTGRCVQVDGGISPTVRLSAESHRREERAGARPGRPGGLMGRLSHAQAVVACVCAGWAVWLAKGLTPETDR
jgi:hypothetical protein